MDLLSFYTLFILIIPISTSIIIVSPAIVKQAIDGEAFSIVNMTMKATQELID